MLKAHWAYVLAVHPNLIPTRPTTTVTHGYGDRRLDGGHMVVLNELPVERIRVPQASGHVVTYVPV